MTKAEKTIKKGTDLTPLERLQAALNRIQSDDAFEADCVHVDVAQGRKVSRRERVLADVVSDLYRILHPYNSNCSHRDWDKGTLYSLKTKE